MKKILAYGGKKISRVGFFGLGASNLAVFNHLFRNYEGLSFSLYADGGASLPKEAEGLFSLGAKDKIDTDMLFLSPSVRRDRKEIEDARRRGVILCSDVEFFFGQRNVTVIAVTGTDGKSTTASLASVMLSENGDFPASANIGLPMTELLSKDDLRGTVAELSSFQLMDFAPPSKRALITNISENHLDWHTSMEEYVRAKENILLLAEQRVFNLDCPYGRRFAEKYPAYAVYSAHLSYAEMKDIAIANHYFSSENGRILLSGEILSDEVPFPLPGKHNLSNFLAALSLSYELMPTEKILDSSRGFQGLSHRIERVGEWNGITFLDSSIDSTPKRTLTTLSAIKSSVVLILGGRGKELSYAPLALMPENVREIVVYGENKDEIYSVLKDVAASVCLADSFDDAVLIAIKKAKSTDTVLLSPASTSFDSFKDYKERGKHFADLVKKYYTET